MSIFTKRKCNLSNGIYNRPSFISDCLETLEEIDIRGRNTFIDAGGEDMTYIPCLNETDLTIELIQDLVKKVKNNFA